MASLSSPPRRSRVRSSVPQPTTSTASPSRENNNRLPTPEYQPLATPLNAKAQQSLAALLSATHFRQVKDYIHQAGVILTDTATEANERASDARSRFIRSSEKRKRAATARRRDGRSKPRTEKQGANDDIEDEAENEEEDEEEEEEEDEVEDEEDEEEQQQRQEELRKLESLEEKVKTTTVQLEERMRGVVDAEHKFSRLKSIIQQVSQDAEAAGAELSAARRRARLRDRGAVDADGDEDMDDAHEDENTAPTLVPSQVLKDKLAENESQWESQTLTQRYTTNNAYVGFYRSVHEAKNIGDETPPVPHASTWFTHLERGQISSAAGGRRRSPNSPHQANNSKHQYRHQQEDGDEEDDDGDEVEIERERISLKCPLTLLTFEDPVKSSKCVHSFERQAIEDMIRASSTMVPAGPDDFQGGGSGGTGRNARARRVRAVPCPVCSASLTLNDLESDLVMLRRVRRARAAELREQEEAEFGGGARRRRGLNRESSGVVIESEDDDDDDSNVDEEDEEAHEREIQERIRIKKERSSRAPTAGEDESDDDE